METLIPYKLDDVQTQLHFQSLAKIANESPVNLQVQESRLGLIQYCLSQGKNLKTPPFVMIDYMAEQKDKAPAGQHEIKEQPQGDLNRQKLATLFAHTAAIGYEFGELSIEPTAVNDLITKIRKINTMSDTEVAVYLDRLVGDKIPGCAQMNMEEFLEGVKEEYKKDGVNFHCALRENFLNDLDVKKIKAAEPSLNYFMPSVFTQQHINSCEVATTLTMLKKVMSNFNQVQEVCLDKSKSLPQPIIEARKEIKKLEEQFQQYLASPTSFKPEFLTNLHANYLKQCEKIQTVLEVEVKNSINKDINLYVKQNKNHSLATLYHMVTTGIVPEGVGITHKNIENISLAKGSVFQQNTIKEHFEAEVDKNKLVKYLNNSNATPDQKAELTNTINKLYLFGKSRAFSESVVCGHNVIVTIDNTGKLKSIEHKNGKAEETILAQTGALAPHPVTTDKAAETIKSIHTSLQKLEVERNSIAKVLRGIRPGSNDANFIESMLVKKDAEIKDLKTIAGNLQAKCNAEKAATTEKVEKPENSAQSAKSITNIFKSSIQALKAQAKKPKEDNVDEKNVQGLRI